jgi:hypothetical protein
MDEPFRDEDTSIIFPDYPEFRPNATPYEMFELGVFGGTYWRPIHSGVTGKDHKNEHKEFDWEGIDEEMLSSTKYDASRNCFQVKAGATLEEWESKDWIKEQDPYGWVQWYCRFYWGRRTKDDRRQINRWLRFAGPKGRFSQRLRNMVKKGKNSPVIRQGLLQWGFLLD